MRIVGLAGLAAAMLVWSVACGDSGPSLGDGTFTPDGGSSGAASSGANGASSSGDVGASSGASGGASSGGSGGSSSGGASSGASGGSSSGGSSSGASGSSSGGAPSLCVPEAAPGAELGVVLELGIPAPIAVTVSEDGLTAAWVRVGDDGVSVLIADRADLQAEFGAARTLTGAYAAARVGVGNNGLTLALVRADRLGFVALRRDDRDSTFAVVDEALSPFSNINEAGVALAEAGARYDDPLFARNDAYFLHSRSGVPSSILLGTRLPVDVRYSEGTAFSGAAFLQASGAHLRRPLALSADLRTLFFFDEVDGNAYVTTRSEGGEFETSTSLGARLDVRPLPDCGTLLYRAPETPSQLRAVSFAQ